MPHYQEWLERMKQAWETKDYEMLSSMFPQNLTYFESPFLPPLTTKQQVVDQWKKDLDKQQDIHFNYKILYEDDQHCFANWSASFVRENATVELNGVFHFKLDADNRCEYFKHWWVVK